MANLPIGLQLYSIRGECEADMFGTLNKVKAMGYEGVEFAGYFDYSIADIRKTLDDLGLPCCGTHTQAAHFEDDKIDATIELNLALGCPYVIVPSLPIEMRNTVEACKTTAKWFNKLSEKMAGHGLKAGFHLHGQDVIALEDGDGKAAWDVLGENTNDAFIMQMDTGNAVGDGADPVAYIKQFPGRSLSVHLKEYAGGHGKASIGEAGSELDWDAIFEASEGIGEAKWYIVEQEGHPTLPPMDAAELSLKNLRKMGK